MDGAVLAMGDDEVRRVELDRGSMSLRCSIGVSTFFFAMVGIVVPVGV